MHNQLTGTDFMSPSTVCLQKTIH